MKASRKGTRLNDAFYFRQPLPHPRKMMTAMCLMPQVSNMQLNCHFAPDRLLQDASLPIKGNPRDHSRKLDIRQSSIEMARITWVSDQDKMDNNRYHSTYAETDKELLKEPEEDRAQIADVELVPEIGEVVEVIEQVESVECDDVTNEILIENYEKKSQRKRFSWWRDINVGQLIYQLFTHFFTKKHASSGKHRTKKVATKYRMQTVANSDKNVKVDKNDRKQRSHHPHSDDLSRPIEEEYDDKAVSMLVRQIERTRDKNLRVTLLEKELRTRTYVEETRKCGFHSEIDERRAARQLSSPLC